jgi:hypothetical protein
MEDIEIEYYESGNDILLILTGIGGTTKGYQNKYEKIAKQVMEQHNFSVVVATSPSGSWLHTEQNMNEIMNFILSKRQKDFKIYAMGNSAGANIVLWHSNKFPPIKKVLAINPVMNINLHLFKALKDIDKEMNIVFGEFDMSSKFAPLLPSSENIKIAILPNIDHNFTNNLNIFLDLPNRFLF